MTAACSLTGALLGLLVDHSEAQANAARLTVLYAPVYLRVGDAAVPRVLTRLPWRGEHGEYLCEVKGEVVCCSRVTLPSLET